MQSLNLLFIFLVIPGKIENIAQGDAAGGFLRPDGIIENCPGNGDPVQACPVQGHLAYQGQNVKTVVADGAGPGQGDAHHGQDHIQIAKNADGTLQQEEPPEAEIQLQELPLVALHHGLAFSHGHQSTLGTAVRDAEADHPEAIVGGQGHEGENHCKNHPGRPSGGDEGIGGGLVDEDGGIENADGLRQGEHNLKKCAGNGQGHEDEHADIHGHQTDADVNKAHEDLCPENGPEFLETVLQIHGFHIPAAGIPQGTHQVADLPANEENQLGHGKDGLDGGEDGLNFYRIIVKEAKNHLNKSGRLYFEIGYNQGKSVSALMKEDFENIEVIKDYGGNDRVVRGVLKG